MYTLEKSLKRTLPKGATTLELALIIFNAFLFYNFEKIILDMKTFYLFLFVILLSPTQINAQLTINTTFGDLNECDTMTRGVYIVWWDKDYNFDAQVDVTLDSMLSYREICLNDMLMSDPPNVLDGHYYNVYIHNPGDAGGFFNSYGWGNGQGTDGNGYPFLTLPNGVLNDFTNTAHETFHIFQYNATAPGFAYSGDSQWYIEASANWFAAKQNMGNNRAFVEAESLVRMPHVPLWLSFNNFPATYPSNWQRYVHQYAMALQLYYLTDVANISDDIITSGMYSGTTEMPQEYMYNQIGGANYRQHFINWAAHMTNDFDFITATQAATNLNEWNTYADLSDDNEFIAVYDNEGSNGWVSPTDDRITNAWSFNTYKLLNNENEFYTFELKPTAEGSFGTPSYFQGKLVIKNDITGTVFYDLSNFGGSLQSLTNFELSANDTEVFLIVASMPEIFQDNNSSFQLFPYEVRITKGSISGLEELNADVYEIQRCNLMGQKVTKDAGGFQIIRYSNGTSQKVFSTKQ
jgi:hypothetical protein